MSVEMEQIKTIRAQALIQIEDLRTDPTPTYTLDGQAVTWTEYIESLQKTVDWCDEKLAMYDPYEIRSEGTT